MHSVAALPRLLSLRKLALMNVKVAADRVLAVLPQLRSLESLSLLRIMPHQLGELGRAAPQLRALRTGVWHRAHVRAEQWSTLRALRKLCLVSLAVTVDDGESWLGDLPLEVLDLNQCTVTSSNAHGPFAAICAKANLRVLRLSAQLAPMGRCPPLAHLPHLTYASRARARGTHAARAWLTCSARAAQ